MVKKMLIGNSPVDGKKYEYGLRPVTAENINVLHDTLYSYFSAPDRFYFFIAFFSPLNSNPNRRRKPIDFACGVSTFLLPWPITIFT